MHNNNDNNNNKARSHTSYKAQVPNRHGVQAEDHQGTRQTNQSSVSIDNSKQKKKYKKKAKKQTSNKPTNKKC